LKVFIAYEATLSTALADLTFASFLQNKARLAECAKTESITFLAIIRTFDALSPFLRIKSPFAL
jgi:hypothetical protein